MRKRQQHNCLFSTDVPYHCWVAWPRKCYSQPPPCRLPKGFWSYSPFHCYHKSTHHGWGTYIFLLVINFLQACYQCIYSLFPGDTNSEWVELTCGAPQGNKLASVLFLEVINFILSCYEERFKYVDDLSVLLKYIVEKSEAAPNSVTK